MKTSYTEIINNLRKKCKFIISKYEEEKSKNSIFQQEIEALKQEIETKNEELHDLETKYNTLKLAKAYSADDDEKQKAKLEINRLVREIDKCIALLNQ